MVVYDERGQSTSSAVIKSPMENERFIKILQEIRREIEQEKDGYPPSADEYMAINRVIKIVDNHISALNNNQFERIWQNTVKEMKRRKIREYETGCTDKKCPFYLNPDYTRCKDCEEKKKAGIMTPVEIARLVAGEYDKHDTEQDKVTQWIKDNADFIKEMARMLEENE